MIRVAEPLPRSHSVLLYILINSILQIMLLLLMCITVNLWHFASVWMLLMKYNVRSTWDRKTPGQCDILSFILIMLEVDTYLEHFQWTLTVQIKTNYRYMYFINLGIAKTTAYHKRWSWFVKHSLWQILNAFEVLYLADIFFWECVTNKMLLIYGSFKYEELHAHERNIVHNIWDSNFIAFPVFIIHWIIINNNEN